MLLLVQYTLIFASVLILVALGGCFSEHSGVINLGLEGIMVIGALGGALAMRMLTGAVSGAAMGLLLLATFPWAAWKVSAKVYPGLRPAGGSWATAGRV